MKKAIALVLSICLILGFAVGCQPATTTQAQKKTITLAYDFIVQDTMMTALWNGIQKAAEDYNAASSDTIVKVIMTNAEAKVDKQLSNVESLIQLKPDVISIISVDQNGSIPAFEAVKKAGIKVVNALKVAPHELADLKVIGMDHFRHGQIQAEWLDKYMTENPNVKLKIGYLNSDPAVTDALARYTGFKENFLDKYVANGRAEEVANTYAYWVSDKALTVVEDWLQVNPDINCIVAASDLMALGAVQAAKAAKKDIIILGIDGVPDAKAAIKEGSMAMTSASDPALVSKGFFDATLALAMGTQTEKIVNLGTISAFPIDSTNVDKFIQ